MSYTPWEPSGAPPRSNRGLAALAAGIVLVLVAAVLVTLIGLNYLGRVSGEPSTTPTSAAAASPTTSAAPTAVALAPSPTTTAGSHPGGLNGPLQATATAAAAEVSPTATADGPALSLAEQALQTLDRTEVPSRDLYSLTRRLRLKTDEDIPTTTGRPPGNYEVGHIENFYLNDIIGKRYYSVTAEVAVVTDHAYWYVQDGQSVDLPALQEVARNFDRNIYPTNRRLFGEEWMPGVDNDPRITVLLASIPGAGGYFSSADEYTRAINPFSNEREIIYVNIGNGYENFGSTLAHEFQHMIHWYESPDHDVWLNEGASELAQWANGYGVGGVDFDYLRNPDTQLTMWQANPDASRANYGASFLFFDFLRANYGGDDTIRSIVDAEGKGPYAITRGLRGAGRSESFEDVFRRWALANLLDEQPGAGAQGIAYPDREVNVSPADTLSAYPVERTGTVNQHGVDYIELLPGEGALEVEFKGQETTSVIAAQPLSGRSVYWSNRGDLADSSMTRTFDLGGLSSATLEFGLWLDTEADLDYGYAMASTDDGKTWDTLKGTNSTDDNPNGTNFGNGYSGRSLGREGAGADGWLRERVDLSPYAGGEVQVRFEYITDDGYNAGGIAVDDIAIPELGIMDDAESDTGWQSAGFARVANELPQRYFLAAVTQAEDDTFEVQPVEVAPDGTAAFRIEGGYKSAVLVVAGMTPHSIHPAGYSLSVRPAK
jgi:immune inhibitor A